MYQLNVFYRSAVLMSMILISYLLLLSMPVTSPNNNLANARCPNGTHKSPSGSCEAVVSHAGLPRCPNGFHRSPSGICEQVTSARNNGGSNTRASSSNGTSNNNTSTQFAAASNNNDSMILSSNTTQSILSEQGKCDKSLWNHVYNPERLQVVAPCRSVLGVIESKRVEKDGDYHIRVKLDPPFSNLINSANIKNQFGDLVVEPICVNRVTQADAISACQNFHQNIVIPPIGSHVNITGSYVLDKEHGNWAEIHPVTSITKIS
jgi:hypothetical protein